MKKTSIQFHASPTEIVSFLNNLQNETAFCLVDISARPFSARALTPFPLNEQNSLSFSNGSRCRLVLSDRGGFLSARTQNEFLDRNAGCLVLDVGAYKEGKLHESALSAMSENDSDIDFAKKVISKFKKITRAGVVAVDPQTGAESRLPNHRYTLGAKIIYDKGEVILSAAGRSYIKFVT